ncbi:YkvA family protein [Limoniibacter endophyticus]|uniref:DUF1232 domain-containing protein n=1 Tax=Limoniibacter endophyticus TaxID=1565040 RepID=A0A8J3GI03_9HYPH|nr:YkvA family protein [Limoniibacter endophyticus]GHC74111.1 hypothetical protein GCM10010136_22960 [Limoniibacter endophyticus]
MQGNGPHDFMTIDAKEEDVRKGFWKKAKRVARRIPFMDEVVAGYYCALDSRTPARSKAILVAALAYFIMPMDAVPDIFLGLGFTDDIAVLTAALAAVQRNITPAHRKAAQDALREE